MFYALYSPGLQFAYKPKALPCEASLHLPLSINDERFDNCLPLTFKCKNERCQTEIVIKDIVTEFVSICFSFVKFEK